MKYAFILLLVLTLATGCAAVPQVFQSNSLTTLDETKAPSKAAPAVLPTKIPTRKPEPTKTTKPTKAPTYTPQPAVQVDEKPQSTTGWKKYTYDFDYAFSTDNWQSYAFENVSALFSIEYPAYWTLDGSVFYDADEKKIAEFSPGLVILKNGQECFDVFVGESDYGNIAFVSEKEITIGRFNGVLRIVKVIYEGGSPDWSGTWYPNEYCLSDGNMAFVMSFFEYELNTGDRELFEEILSSLRFE